MTTDAWSAPLDRWAEWLVRTRFADWTERDVERVLADLCAVRETVLDRARLARDAVVLDVGTGTGLLAFGALRRLNPAGRVIALDVSEDCLVEVAALARADDAAERLECVRGDAAALPLTDAAVDAVVTRSVLIYLPLEAKAAAAREFLRVLRPGGRCSLFEPVNRRNQPLHEVAGFDRLGELGARAAAWEEARAADASDPLVDFDETDLARCFTDAGFTDVVCDFRRVPWAMPAEAVLSGVLVPGRRPLVHEWREMFEAAEVELLAATVRQGGKLFTRELGVLYLSAVKAR
jgi:arsenite methyltransferase